MTEAQQTHAAALCARNNLAVRDAAGLAPEASDAELELREMVLREARREMEAEQCRS